MTTGSTPFSFPCRSHGVPSLPGERSGPAGTSSSRRRLRSQAARQQSSYAWPGGVNRCLVVGNGLLFHPATPKLKELIEVGYLGEVLYVPAHVANVPHGKSRVRC